MSDKNKESDQPVPMERVVMRAELELLESIAYCSMGLLTAEREENIGDAKEWKRHLENETGRYNNYKYG